MRRRDLPQLLREGVLDTPTAALLWLLLEGRVPLVVAGPASAAERATLAAALLSFGPDVEWALLDAADGSLGVARLAALLRGGTAFAVCLAAGDLEAVFDQLESAGLPADAVRRLGVVLIAATTAHGLRCTSVHYLRPAERDARGHIQRRPPAVLATWHDGTDSYEDYAWGITPELADRLHRWQADLEERRAWRAEFLADLAFAGDQSQVPERVARYLRREPAMIAAPPRPAARPSPFHGGLLDPDEHGH